jgi:hypothetical protein
LWECMLVVCKLLQHCGSDCSFPLIFKQRSSDVWSIWSVCAWERTRWCASSDCIVLQHNLHILAVRCLGVCMSSCTCFHSVQWQQRLLTIILQQVVGISQSVRQSVCYWNALPRHTCYCCAHSCAHSCADCDVTKSVTHWHTVHHAVVDISFFRAASLTSIRCGCCEVMSALRQPVAIYNVTSICVEFMTWLSITLLPADPRLSCPLYMQRLFCSGNDTQCVSSQSTDTCYAALWTVAHYCFEMLSYSKALVHTIAQAMHWHTINTVRWLQHNIPLTLTLYTGCC